MRRRGSAHMSKQKMTYTKLFWKKAKVIQHPDPSVRGIEGIIIDETQNTIKLRTERGEKVVLKNGVVIEIKREKEDKVIVRDNMIRGRPEERVKKLLMR
jgi:ribonuclease P protein subunit POP4